MNNMSYDYEQFKTEVFKLTQIDLNAYKEKQMKRRIDTLILRHNLKDYENFVKSLKTDKAVLEDFVNYLTINVSEFYRNPDQWKILDETVFPDLIGKFGKRLKVWSAACSTGDEPYSLVMALTRHVNLNEININATDIDKQVILTAKNGIYNDKSIVGVPADMKSKYFKKLSDSSFQIDNCIKERVTFKEHNLLKDPYPTGVQLIVCRNVLIYFTEEAKEEIFRKFYDALAPGGILFLGSTEQMMSYKEIGYERRASFFFEKPMK